MAVSTSRIDWQQAGDPERLVLTVAGPEGLWFRKELAVGQAASLSLSDEKGQQLADGTYTYELRAASGRMQSGHFSIKDGSFVTASAKPPLRKVTANLTDDDLIIQGNACIGEECTNGDDDFPVLKLKGQHPNIFFDDIESPPSLLSSSFNDWGISINPSDVAGFSIVDVDGGFTPFSILGGAPDNSLFISGNGDVGIGTATPAEKIHIIENVNSNTIVLAENTSNGTGAAGAFRAKSDTAQVSFQAHGSGRTLTRFGQTLGGWSEFLQVSGNGLAIGTLGATPLILGTNNTNRIHIAGSGNVGIGTANPLNSLHVSRSNGTAKILVEETSGTAAPRELLDLRNPGGAALILDDTNDATRWATIAFGSAYLIDNQANAGVEVTVSSTGNMTISGTLTQGSDRAMKEAIIPVQPEEVLEKLASLPISTWSRKDEDPKVRHLGPMAQDFSAIFGLGEDNRHIAPLDMAGVSMASIQALHGKMTREMAEKDAEISALRQRLATLEELVSKLAAPQ